MKKRRNIEVYIIELILIAGIFNDLLRLPGTSISLFRLLIPVGLLLVIKYANIIKNYIVVFLFLLMINYFQVFTYILVLKYENNYNFLFNFKYIFLYFSIWLIFALIHIINIKYKNVFENVFKNHMRFLGVWIIIAYYFSVIRIPDYIDNQNNYAGMLALLFPWFLIQIRRGKRKYVIFTIIIILELIWGDSKAALLGVAIELLIITIISVSQKVVETGFFITVLMIIGIVVGYYLISNIDITINSYNIRIMVNEIKEHILANSVYDISDKSTSLTYRVNSTVYMLRTIWESKGVGMGLGNSSRVLTMKMSGKSINSETIILAPHFPMLEFVADNGWWAIVAIIFVLIHFIKKMICCKKIDETEIYGIAVVISFLVWNMSSSVIYTIYYIFEVFAWIFENEKNIKKNRIGEKAL